MASQWAERLHSASPSYILLDSPSLGSSRNSHFAVTCSRLSVRASDSGPPRLFSRSFSERSTSETPERRRSALSWRDALDWLPLSLCGELKISGYPSECMHPLTGEKRIFTALPTAASWRKGIFSNRHSADRTG